MNPHPYGTITTMPEGDSVFQLASRMQFLVGREVLHTDLRVASVATTTFTGETVERIWPYGKHLFMQLGERVLHTHLKMEGTWSFHLKGDRWKKPGYKARVVLAVDGTPHPRPIEAVGFELGFVRVFLLRDYPDRIAHLGPDVLGENWNPEEATKRILARPERPIGTALLDQRNLAGVGNEYRAEVCFIAGVHPATPVTHTDVSKIVDIVRRVMWANRNSPIRVTTGVRRAGENGYVFGRNNRPCRRCGTLIVKGELGGVDKGGDEGELERIIWWCPACQPRVL